MLTKIKSCFEAVKNFVLGFIGNTIKAIEEDVSLEIFWRTGLISVLVLNMTPIMWFALAVDFAEATLLAFCTNVIVSLAIMFVLFGGIFVLYRKLK